MRGFVSFMLFSILSAILLSPLFFRPPAPNFSQAYESDGLYYSLSSFKRALADSAYNSAIKASSAYRAALAAGAALPISEDDAARNAAALAMASTAAGFNENFVEYNFEFGCGSLRTMAECNESLMFLPSEISGKEPQLLLTSDIFVSARNSRTGGASSGAIPKYSSLGERK